MRAASSGWERPEKTISRFCGPRSIKWPCWLPVTVAISSRPGRTSSLSAAPSCIPLLVLLTCPRDREGVGRNIVGDGRSGGRPCSVSEFDRCDEAIVDAGPDVPADPCPALGPPGLVREVGGDRARADVA